MINDEIMEDSLDKSFVSKDSVGSKIEMNAF